MPLGSLEFGLLLMDAEWRRDAGTEAATSGPVRRLLVVVQLFV